MEVLVISLPYSLAKPVPLVPKLLLGISPALLSAYLLFGPPPWSSELWSSVGATALFQSLALFSLERTASIFRQNPFQATASYLAAGTLFLIAFLSLGRFYYSWSFLLLSTLAAFLLFWFWLLACRTPLIKVAVLPRDMGLWIQPSLKARPLPLKEDEWDEVQAVVVDLHRLEPVDLPFLAKAALMGKPLLHAGHVYERLTGRIPLELAEVDGEGINLAKPDKVLPYLPFKRAWETLFVLAASPLILPLMGLIALLVYLDLGRPVLFTQERMGLGGKPFKAWKFRTMRGAPRTGIYAGEERNRITPLGKILRRFRLDELPQLWNILKGEMALVGPRPEQYVLADEFSTQIPLYSLRHVVRPGLTGWAQVQHGYAEGLEETKVKLSYDLFYIKHISFWMDLYILMRTVKVILGGFGAK